MRPGDVIRLKIWREPELSGEYQVDQTGQLSLPLIGTMRVTTKTVAVLKQEITTAYKASVQDLAMEMILLRRTPVVGAVRVPGLYAIDPTMTAADALALSGGSILDAAKTKIHVIRQGTVDPNLVDPTTLIFDLEMQAGDQLYVPPVNSFLTRYPWVPGTIIQSAISIMVTLIAVRSR